MTDADEDRQRQHQGQRQTRQDRTYPTTEALPINLWLPYSDCIDWFSNRNFHRDSQSSTHIANNSTLHSQYASGPVVDFSPRRREEERRGKTGQNEGKVVSGVSGVCVCVCLCVCFCVLCVLRNQLMEQQREIG